MDALDDFEGRSGLPEFLKDPRGVVRRRWVWMLVVLVIGTIASSAYIAGIPVTYEASARLLLTHQRIPEDFVRQTSMEGVPEMLNAIVGEILSRESLIAVAEAQNLVERTADQESSGDLTQSMREAVTVDQDLLRATQDWRRGAAESIILAIRFQSSDPVVAADVANELSRRFISVHLRRQSRQARLTSDFLSREAERAEVELAEQRARITEFTKAHRGELPSELDTKLARLERLQQQSQSLALQISDAEGRLLIMQGQNPLDTQERLLEELRARLVQEQTIYTDEHPNVIAVRRQIEALEAEVALEQAGAGTAPVSTHLGVAVVQREVGALRAQVREVERQIRELDAAVAEIPARQEELMALEQREQLLRERFIEASRKVQEAELAEDLQKAQQGFHVSQLDVATPPAEPMSTRWKFALLAAGAVFSAAAGIGLLLEVADPVIVTPRQLETQTGMVPLGVIPRIR